jgi:hypothetical protein
VGEPSQFRVIAMGHASPCIAMNSTRFTLFIVLGLLLVVLLQVLAVWLLR